MYSFNGSKWIRFLRLLAALSLLLFPIGEAGFAKELSSPPRLAESRCETDGAEERLSVFVRDPAPWLDMKADSEQQQPVYLGSTPREMMLRLPPEDGGRLLLHDILRDRAEVQIKGIRTELVETGLLPEKHLLQLEAWPARNNDGLVTWAFARWRIGGNGLWSWLEAGMLADSGLRPLPILPVLLRPYVEMESSLIFGDFTKFPDLYQKRAYGNCLWTDNTHDAGNSHIFGGWLSPEQAEADHPVSPPGERICRVLPQPSRWNGRGKTLILEFHDGRILWPMEIAWKSAAADVPVPTGSGAKIRSWPEDFRVSYENDLLALSGESDAIFPISGRRVVFRRKNSSDKDNQLRDVAQYLEERYTLLGLETVRQTFAWRGIPQENLIAIIRGTASGDSNRPILLADHVDTAFCEDEFERKGERISAPGADDNASATAALLRAAEILKDSKPLHDIWLVHFTGEEFPADGLGARHFLGRMLKAGEDIGGLVLLDMIGHREGDDRIFQINAGESAGSLRIAAVALDASLSLATPSYLPALRMRQEERSYLYNTDGLLFSETGYPVVLINEHLNALENLNRKGYHDSTDTSKTVDWEYATVLARVAIETVARLSGAFPP
jgi:hypothetical protein